jgi:hypothetical protein
MDQLFSMYANHEQKKMDIIKYLAAAEDPNDIGTQNYALYLAGATASEFSERELREMEAEIMRRRS